jgi:hypothetical protein
MSPPTALLNESSPVLDAWEANRLPFLQMAIASGNLHALYFGFSMNLSGSGPGGQSRPIPKDLHQAVVYGTALLPFLGPDSTADFHKLLDLALRELPAGEAAQAATEGVVLRAKYFASAAPVFDTGNVNDADSTECSAMQ